MLLLKKVKIADVSEFLILSYTQNRKLGNLGKCCFISNFDSIYYNFFRICIFCKESEALFFLWLLILSHIFPENFIKVPHVVQKIFRFSRSILIFSSIFWVFWHFLVNKRLLLPSRFYNLLVVTKKLMTSNITDGVGIFLLSTYFKQVV